MSRVKGTCKGDCGSCELLANGEVDMIPCVLDQIFQRVQKNEKAVAELNSKIDSRCRIDFSGVEPVNVEEDVQEND